MTSILVTGSTGFIGTETVKVLSAHSELICPVRQLNEDMNRSVYKKLGALDESTDWAPYLSGIDVVVHLAGKAHGKNNSGLSEFLKINTQATLNLAKQAANAGVKRFVFISSIGVLGTSTQGAQFDEFSSVQPKTDYAISKHKAELGLMKLAENSEIDVVIIRPPLVYGKTAPGNFGKLIQLTSKLPILPFGLINNRRSLISVNNLADFISACCFHAAAKNEIFVISDLATLSTKTITNNIANALNKKVYQLPVPNKLFSTLGMLLGQKKMVEQLVGDVEVNADKAHKLIDWTPPYTMAETLKGLA